jgi:VanZ family protein
MHVSWPEQGLARPTGGFFLSRRAIVMPLTIPSRDNAVLKLLHTLLLTSDFPRLRYWGAMAMFALIVIIGSIPGARADAAEVASGIVLHSIAYAVLAFLVFTGSTGSPAQRAPKAVLTIATMGAFDELVQSFLPYRHGAVGDWLVDVTAAMLTATLLWVLWSTRKVPGR